MFTCIRIGHLNIMHAPFNSFLVKVTLSESKVYDLANVSPFEC